METLQHPVKRPFPAFAVIPTLLSIASNFILYSVPQLLCGNLKHVDMTTAFDRLVPVVPVFTPIYLSFFIVWLVNFILVGYQGKERFYRFLTADFMGRIICAIFFVLLPTTNIRPVVENSDVFCRMLNNVVYGNDAATNLFPSVHCYVSWLCFIGVSSKSSPLPTWYKVLVGVYASLILIATQVLKQHVIADLIAAVALAYGMVQCNKRINAYRFLQRICEGINRLLHIGQKQENCG